MTIENSMRLRFLRKEDISSLSEVFRLDLRLAQKFIVILIVCFSIMLQASVQVFRYHIQKEPDSLDPAKSRNTLSSYVLNSLYVPLLTYQEGKLRPGGATKCTSLTSTHYRCELRRDWAWSDGVPVTSDQIVTGFQALKTEKSVRVDHYKNIKNVSAKSKYLIDFILHAPDNDFIYRLVDPALGPRRENLNLKSGLVTYGAYYVSERIPGRSLYLKPNLKFEKSMGSRPEIEVLIVDSDDTALRLFETKKLNFLRRLTTEHISLYKKSPMLMQKPMHRIDYIGISPSLDLDLRKRLIYGLEAQYKKFIKIFDALGRPGCFGLEKSIVKSNSCYPDVSVGRYSNAEIKKIPKLSLLFALQGGDDISRTMEFFQAGWKKNLNLNVELESQEHTVLTHKLKDSPPPLFRRGVQLERPTCLAALEVFESNNPENYVKIKSQVLDDTIRDLRTGADIDTQKLCNKGLKAILDAHRIIPLGSIHFSMLTDNQFVGFTINELNQLDVSRLSSKASSTKVR